MLALSLIGFGCASHHADVVGEYQSTYHHSLRSPGEQFMTLPPGVQNTVRAQAGTAEIRQIVEEKIDGREVYTVLFQNNVLYPPLFLAEDGSILNPNLTYAMGAPKAPGGILTGGAASGLKLQDLPAPVFRVLQEREAGATVKSIQKQAWGDQTVYVVDFQDGEDIPRMYITADGTVLKESQR